MKLDDELAVAHRLADAARETIRPHFRKASAEFKGDASPVTVADREAEDAMRAILMAEYAQDGIVGEEYPEHQGRSGRQWVLDPIDGTISFIAGRPIFGTLIALVRNGAPILGVIDQPIGGERWIGLRGHGATLNGNPIRVRECPTLADATIGTTAPDLFDLAGAKSWQQTAAAARHVIYGGDCYTYAQIATGLVDAVVEAGLQTYDFAALAPVVEEAGGGAREVTTSTGKKARVGPKASFGSINSGGLY